MVLHHIRAGLGISSSETCFGAGYWRCESKPVTGGGGLNFRVWRLVLGVAVLTGVLLAQNQIFDSDIQTEEQQQAIMVPPYQVSVAGTALEQAIVPDEYMVGPGDRFIVSVLSVESYLTLVTVSPTETLVLPGIGTLAVAGLSAAEVSEQVLSAIEDVYPRYEASCTLYGIREIRVSVSGAVKQPGLAVVTPVSRLTDLLELVGGVQPEALLHRIQLIRINGESELLDLTSYYYDGDLFQNPYLKGGDRVIVPYGEIAEDLVLVRGLGTGTGYHAIRSGETLAALLRRLTLGNNAERGSMTIQRRAAGDQSDLVLVTADQFANTPLLPGDIIYIDLIDQVVIVGEVRSPGRLAYQPGLTAEDYITLAGGATSNGSAHRVEVIRKSGQTMRNRDTQVQAGDTIYVPRSFNSVFLGQLGMIQAALTFLNIYLAYLAARAS